MVLVSSYYKQEDKDVLIVQVQNNKGPRRVESKQGVTQIKNDQTGELVGYNFFAVADEIPHLAPGPVQLTADQVDVLNRRLDQAGFAEKLSADPSAKLVVGYVEECQPMEDSDHLHITQTRVDGEQVLQIVCGAPNIEQGLKVVVAKEGAILPDGTVIWDGVLRGTESQGMICSARELGLKNAPQRRGILILDEEAEVGSAFKG